MKQSRMVVGCVVLSLVVTGCATDSQMSDQTQSTVQGAGVGALVGALTGALVSKDKGKGALIGGLVGGFAGAVVGDNIGQMKQQRVAKEENLDRQIAQTNEYRILAENYQEDLKKTVRQLAAESSTLRQREQRGLLEKRDVENHLAHIKSQRDNLNKTVSALREELKAKEDVYAYKSMKSNNQRGADGVASKEKLDTMQQEVRQLRVAINDIDKNDQQLAELSSDWR